MSSLREKLFHPWLSVRIQILLGVVLLAATWHKILDLPDFANVIYHYKLFPAQSINLFAIYVPWIEVILGVALFAGVARRGASFMAMGLFLSFIAVLGYNLYRGCPTVCGCFSTFAAGQHLTDAEKFAEMRTEIGIDIACFLLAAHVFAASFLPERRGTAAVRAGRLEAQPA
ncbi:MAG: DoxX family membrane protein [Planctomycetes bacterium]|nr:DoxX family membrane protein [Planctomycetota bacterium]